MVCYAAEVSANSIVPDPEEIQEAFEDGLIEFEDYQRLLELSRNEYHSREDSLFLMQFPDLLTGFSSGPLIDRQLTTPEIPSESRPVQISQANDYKARILFRQYNRINVEAEHKNLYRLNFRRARFQMEGERESFYSKTERWGRRSVSYDLKFDQDRSAQVVVGSYSTRLSMGLIFGYHGQFLTKESSRDDGEKFLFPDYGGSNGILISMPLGKSRAVILSDVDRNESHTKQFTAASIPIQFGKFDFRINGGVGQLKNRTTGEIKKYSLLSVGGDERKADRLFEGEGAVATVDSKLQFAGSARLTRRRVNSSVDILAWSYSSDFPSWFSGGPSSRRYQSVAIESLDLTVRDRFQGETGGAIKSSLALLDNITLRTVFGYSRRSADDNRFEYKFGVDTDVGNFYLFRLNLYRRLDNIYFSKTEQTRIQAQLSRRGDIGGRIVAGYRFEKQIGRNDFLFLIEGRLNDRWGRLMTSVKLDRLEPGDLQNRYLFLTISHDSNLGGNLKGFIKYSYYYRKGNLKSSLGTLRWEMVWNLN